MNVVFEYNNILIHPISTQHNNIIWITIFIFILMIGPGH